MTMGFRRMVPCFGFPKRRRVKRVFILITIKLFNLVVANGKQPWFIGRRFPEIIKTYKGFKKSVLGDIGGIMGIPHLFQAVVKNLGITGVSQLHESVHFPSLLLRL
jgi:hypothetical protein